MTENEIRELFASIKWGDKFCCTKCGHDKFTKGNKFQDRRCQACRTNESLYLNTALEGLRFSNEKMYAVLETIYNTVQISHDTDIILVEGAYISIEQFKSDYKHRYPGKAGRSRMFEIINHSLMSQQVSLTEIAKRDGLEQNTLALRLRRIADRIPPFYQSEYYYDTLKALLLSESVGSKGRQYIFSFNDLLKIVLYPTKGVWKKGILHFKKDTYEFWDEPDIVLIKDEVGVVPHIPYASKSWKSIFVGDSVTK